MATPKTFIFEWPEGQSITGTAGKVTKDAIRSWRARRGLDPDAPMSRADTARLIAGPRGYQDGKKWRYGDGEQAAAP